MNLRQAVVRKRRSPRAALVFSFGALTAAASLGALAAPGDAHAQTPPATPSGAVAESDALLRQGVQLRQQGRDDQALDAFRRAYELTHGARALGQMALAEQAIGRWVDAHEHMTETLRAAADPWVVQNQAALQTSMATINEHVGRVIVNATVEGAEVLVNNRVVGTTPLREPVRAVAGTAAVTVRAPRFIAMNRHVTVTAGSLTRESFELVPDPNAAGAPIPPRPAGAGATPGGATPAGGGTPAPARAGGGTSPVLWLGIGATVIGGAGAITLSVLASSAASNYEGAEGSRMGMGTALCRDQLASSSLMDSPGARSGDTLLCALDAAYYQGYVDAASLGANLFWGLAGAGLATTVVGIVLTAVGGGRAAPPPDPDRERDDREETSMRRAPRVRRAALQAEPTFGGVRVSW